jgi:hypothetical protein
MKCLFSIHLQTQRFAVEHPEVRPQQAGDRQLHGEPEAR